MQKKRNVEELKTSDLYEKIATQLEDKAAKLSLMYCQMQNKDIMNN
ncbi:MAG: hypothetical protein ACE5GU_05045 [Candidatus Scalinduaceae bacterium]